jgi:hypothetical protein
MVANERNAGGESSVKKDQGFVFFASDDGAFSRQGRRRVMTIYLVALRARLVFQTLDVRVGVDQL